MSRYIVKKALLIKVQEDNSCNIVINVPAEISLTGMSAELTVTSGCGDEEPKIVFSTTNGKISIAGQVITVTILPADTAGKAGLTDWYLKIFTSSTNKVTIGKGKFHIIADNEVV